MAPYVDPNQNITDVSVQQVVTDNGTYTIMTFTRPLCSNGESDDIALTEDPYLLYSWGPVNNFDGNDRDSIGPHVRRGASNMTFDFLCNGKLTSITRMHSTHHIATMLLFDVVQACTYNNSSACFHDCRHYTYIHTCIHIYVH